ncbi:MAG: hypothetical protein NTZ48_05735 [Candidatus Omnitrophica bacterium]|nr:hypothetical protein [Candidatus Omnitrophota bacterium]
MRRVFSSNLILGFLSLAICGILFVGNVISSTFNHNGGDLMITRRTKEANVMTPADLAANIAYIMGQLKITDTPRVIQIFRTSTDPVAFVKELSRVSGKSTDIVLSALGDIPFFATVAADYRVRTAASFDSREFASREMNVSVSAQGYNGEGGIDGVRGQPITDYLNLKRQDVSGVPFVFRNDMASFVGRFLGLSDIEGQANPDLWDIVQTITDFLSKIDLPSVKYVLSSGIGANEMYSHQLAQVVNKYFEAKGKSKKWIVVNNPADLSEIPEDATNGNTVIFEMSRSGGTKETLDFFNATRDRFKNRIVAANTGALKDAALVLAGEEGANILIIDDTPGDIGGRQMNRKTLMAYAPLFIALSAGFGNTNEAVKYLGEYCGALYDANEELSYTTDSSQAVGLAEFLFRQRAAGRNKFSVVFDPSLAASANELFQLVNEGANKKIAGGSNNNILVKYNLAEDRALYGTVFEQAPSTQLPIFLLNENSANYKDTLAYIEGLRAKGIPCIVFSVNLNEDEDLENNLSVLARTSALLQDTSVYYTYITNQDANSNPAVKFVREITTGMFGILRERRAAGIQDVRMSFADVINKVSQLQAVAREKAKSAVASRGVTRDVAGGEFSVLVNAISDLSARIGIADTAVTSTLVSSVSRSVVQTDVGEAGGSKIQEIPVAFANSGIDKTLGRLTTDPKTFPLDQQVILENEDNMRVSVAVGEDSQIDLSVGTLAERVACYLIAMYRQRSDQIEQLALTYMEADSGNPLIQEIAGLMVNAVADLNITVPLLGLPGVAHQGIEAIMSHPESILNIAVLYTNTYGEGLGTQSIDATTTVDDATYVYGFSNVTRMAIGGTPSVIFEVKNSAQLEEIKAIIEQAMAIFRAGI